MRYAPQLALVLGLRRALHPHPRWVSVPRGEGGPLASVVLEPGVAGGRVPAGRGLAHLEARLDYVAAAGTAPDDVLVKELQEAFEGVLEGARGAAAWSRLYRLPLADASLRRRPLPRDRRLRARRQPTSAGPAGGSISPATT